jgi:phospholipase/lecithinase/hemolysin
MTGMNFHVPEKRARLARSALTTLPTILQALALAFYLTATGGYSFTALYVFGDSLSDTGRNPPPAGTNYYMGRYSNGPLWVEYLSADLGIPYNPSNNFAVSGSTTADLPAQIAGLKGATGLQTALFTLLSGGNDFIANTSTGLVNNAVWGTFITNTVDNLTNAIGELYTNGARHIVVGNLANLAQTPVFIEDDFGTYSNLVVSKVNLFNQVLYAAVTNEMQQFSGLRLYLLDDNAGLSNVLSAPAAYGFTVTMRGALEDPSLTDKSFNGPGADYVFWDVLHPTTKLDALTASAAFAAVEAELDIVRSGTNFTLDAYNLYPTLPYTIQSSTNLLSWSNYLAFTATSTNTTLTLTNQPGKREMFYRVSY